MQVLGRRRGRPGPLPGVDDRGQWALRRREGRGDRPSVREVAGDQLCSGTGTGQFGAQHRRPRVVSSAWAEQQEVADAVARHQVPGHGGGGRAVGAGEHDRAPGVEPRALAVARGPHEFRQQHRPRAHRELGFAGGDPGVQRGRRRALGPAVEVGEVGEHQSTGKLVLRGAHPSPSGRLVGVRYVLVRARRDGPAREDDDAGALGQRRDHRGQLRQLRPRRVHQDHRRRRHFPGLDGGQQLAGAGPGPRRHADGDQPLGQRSGPRAEEAPPFVGDDRRRAGDRGPGDPVGPEQRVELPAGRGPQPRGLPGQDVPGDLAGRGARDTRDLVQLLRYLEGRQLLAARGEQPGGVEPTGPRHEERDRHFTQHLVWFPHHGHVRHTGNLAEDVLHLTGVDVLPTPDDQFLDAAGHREIAGLVPSGQVTGAVPAVPHHLGGGSRLVVVADHHAGAPDPHLALGVERDVDARVGVHDPNPEARHRKPAGTLDPPTRRPVDRDGPAGLGTAVGVEQRRGEDLLERPAQGGGRDRAAHQAHPQVRGAEPGLAGRPHQVVVHGGHAGEERRRVPFDRLQHVLGREPVDDPGGGADGGDGQDAGDVRQAVEEGQRPHDPVVSREPGYRYVAGGDRPQAVSLGGEHSLGFARGSGGVEHPGEVVEAEVVAGGGGRLGGGHRLEELRAPRRVVRHPLVPDDHDGHVPPTGEDVPEPREVGGVRDDHAGAAVVEQVGQLRLADARVERHADGPGAQDREVALHDLDAVAEADRGTVTWPQPQCDEVAGEPPGASLQLPVGHRPGRVVEGDLVADPVGVLPEQFRQRPDQLGTQHATTSVGRAVTSTAVFRQGGPGLTPAMPPMTP